MKNITKHKKVETEFENNNKLLQITLDAMSESVFLIDSDHKILQCNKATLDILGKSTYNEIIGHSCWELLHCTSGQVDWCPVKRMRQSGQRETTIQMINGKWVEISVDPVLNDKGEITGAVHVITDISAQKKAENALSESEQQYLTILNSLGDAMHVVDKDLRFIFQNPAMIQWLEKLNVNSDIIDKNLFEAFPFLNYDKVYNEYIKVFKTGELLTTNEITHLFGRLVFTETMKIPVKSEGSVNQIITIMRDITEQKEAQQRLKESEEKYRSLVENAHEGVWAVDENDDTIFVNQKICEMLGYTKDEMMGKKLDLFLEDSAIELVNSYRKRREKGLKDTYEHTFIKKDGTLIHSSIKAAPILKENGEFKGSFAYINDITDRKIAEQKLKESEEKYRLISENTDDLIAVYNKDGIVEYLNAETHSRVLGYTPEEFLDKSFKDALVHKDDRELADQFGSEGLEKIRVLIASEQDWKIKGSNIAILALSKIWDKVSVSIIAHGKDLFKSLVYAKSLGLKLNLLPRVPHEKMNEYYWSHDVIIDRFAIGSMGVVSLEAVRCGKPVLCFVCSGFPEHKEFPLLDLLNPFEIADLVLDPGDLWRKELDFVEKYHSCENVIPKLSRIYEEVSD